MIVGPDKRVAAVCGCKPSKKAGANVARFGLLLYKRMGALKKFPQFSPMYAWSAISSVWFMISLCLSACEWAIVVGLEIQCIPGSQPKSAQKWYCHFVLLSVMISNRRPADIITNLKQLSDAFPSV